MNFHSSTENFLNIIRKTCLSYRSLVLPHSSCRYNVIISSTYIDYFINRNERSLFLQILADIYTLLGVLSSSVERGSHINHSLILLTSVFICPPFNISFGSNFFCLLFPHIYLVYLLSPHLIFVNSLDKSLPCPSTYIIFLDLYNHLFLF